MQSNASGSVSERAIPSTGQSVLQHDRFDALAFAETREAFAPLDDIAMSQSIPEAGTFTEDMFCSFYKAAPTLEAEEGLSLTAQIRRHLLDEVMNTAEYQRVRNLGTVSDQYSSAMATASTAYQVLDTLDKKTKNRLRDMQQAEQAAQQLFSQAQTLAQVAEETEGDEAEGLRQEAESLRAGAEQHQGQAQAAYDELAANMEHIEDAARRAARESLQRAGDELEETNEAVSAYSGYSYEQGQPQQRMRTTEKLELAQKIRGNKKLARIAELAGKMVNTALQKQRNKVIHPPDEIVGITVGDNLPQVLPPELLLLDDELTEMLFYQRYVERSLMQYDMIGHEMQSKGPIIACVDESGSMEQVLINERRLAKKLQDLDPEAQAEARAQAYQRAYTKEIWSKAVLLALLAVARHQHRDFCVVYFSYQAIKTYTFLKAKATTAELIDLAQCFLDGGTTFDEWMEESLKIAESGPFADADIILISDGDVRIADHKRDEFNARRQARSMHCYGVLLEQGPQAKRSAEVLRSITDQMITISDLDTDTKALDLMFSI